MCILINCIQSPQLCSNFSVQKWKELLVQAKSANILGQLKYLLDEFNVEIPKYAQWHFQSYCRGAQLQSEQIIFELYELKRSLPEAYFKDVVILKGAAYTLLNLKNHLGRKCNDIDILVNQDNLKTIEVGLHLAGWIKTEIDDYNEAYYRTWMHEIPPLQHSIRGTVIDVHHNILPKTNKHYFDAALFNFIEVENEWFGKVKVLSNSDMLIHCSVHLFTEGEFHNGLRDLYDLHRLITEFKDITPNFIEQVTERAIALGLADYLYLALRYTQIILNTDISKHELDKLSAYAPKCTKLWDFVFINVLKPDVKSCRTWKMSIAQFFAYWRGHLIRMPLRLLIPHLAKKSWMQLKDRFQKKQTANQPLP